MGIFEVFSGDGVPSLDPLPRHGLWRITSLTSALYLVLGNLSEVQWETARTWASCGAGDARGHRGLHPTSRGLRFLQPLSWSRFSNELH